MRAAILIALAALAAATPAHARRNADIRANYMPSYPAPPPPSGPDGAIFHANYGYAPLTSGARAAMVGDVLTIQLVERTQASKSTSASSDRSGNIGITPPTTGPLSLFSASDAAVGAGGTFKGAGAAAQSNSLSGEISVTVAEVYPNGTMLVRGEKMLTLNRGDEHIRIAGIVRPVDIDANNSVLSTRVADARITYSGTGEIARASHQGWLGRFFSRVSPF